MDSTAVVERIGAPRLLDMATHRNIDHLCGFTMGSQCGSMPEKDRSQSWEKGQCPSW